MKIAIDPGHSTGTGSYIKLDNGAALVEESLNWQIASKLDAMLSQDGHIVKLSRRETEPVPLKERARRAVSWGADIALSIHHNMSQALALDDDASEEDVAQEKAKALALREQYAKTEIYIVEPNFWVPDEGHPQLNTPFNRVRVYRTDPVDARNSWMQARVANVLYPYTKQGLHNVALLECGYLDAPSHQQIINQPGYVERMSVAIRNWIEARERKQVSA